MLLLASVTDLLDDLGYTAMTDITYAVTDALLAASAELSAVLDTDFDAGTFIDTYYVQEPRYRSGPAAQVEFRLSHGLVTSLTQVLLSPDPTQFGNTTYTTDVTANVTVDNDRGVVKDFKTTSTQNYVPAGITNMAFMSGYTRQFVQISYAAGLPVDANNAASYDLTQVPIWLNNAAKLAAKLYLADSPILSEASIKLDKQMLARQYDATLSRKKRYAPLSILPL
jgi:hypothetical protein